MESTEDRMVTCPYNSSHIVQGKRFVRHLLRCRRNHQDSGLKVCPYNARHVIPEPEFKYHLAGCVDGRLLEQNDRGKYAGVGCKNKGCTAIPAPRTQDFDFGDGEDWDKEPSGVVPRKFTLQESRRPRAAAKVQSHASLTCYGRSDS